MDGNFVPNITFGFDFTNALSKMPIPRDIHLMVLNPEFAINKLLLNKNDIVFFHIEATEKVEKLITLIAAKCNVGLVVNASTPIEALSPYLSRVDFVYLMTIKKTGFSGEPFDKDSYSRAKKICSYILNNNLSTTVGVDGAIGIQQIRKFKEIGVRMFVLGTKSIYLGDLERNLIDLKKLLASNSMPTILNRIESFS